MRSVGSPFRLGLRGTCSLLPTGSRETDALHRNKSSLTPRSTGVLLRPVRPVCVGDGASPPLVYSAASSSTTSGRPAAPVPVWEENLPLRCSQCLHTNNLSLPPLGEAEV